ncbi:MAG: DUF3159 domain-containing protein [Microbacteriaceae bacterium]|nr:DUF3159 domain-containing protein [Microbacteriaceae bacterium]
MAQQPRGRKGVADAVRRAARGEQASAAGVLQSLGGVRGIIEMNAPIALFLICYLFTKNAGLAALVAIGVAFLLLLVRIASRINPMPGVLSVGGVVVCALWMHFRGQDEAYFEPGFWTSGTSGVVMLLSLLARWPLLGIIAGFFGGKPFGWRRDKVLWRAAVWCTVLWTCMFFGRLAVQLPLYFAKNIEALGIARLLMGMPLYAIVVLITWRVFAVAYRVSAQREQVGNPVIIDADDFEKPVDRTPDGIKIITPEKD